MTADGSLDHEICPQGLDGYSFGKMGSDDLPISTQGEEHSNDSIDSGSISSTSAPFPVKDSMNPRMMMMV
jgi:hypothetical protein